MVLWSKQTTGGLEQRHRAMLMKLKQMAALNSTCLDAKHDKTAAQTTLYEYHAKPSVRFRDK